MEGVKMVYSGEKMVYKWYIENNCAKIRKYECDLCLFMSTNKKDFLRHLKTNKHGTKWYMTYGNHENYVACEECDYISSDINKANDHFEAFLHSKKTPKKPQKNPTFYEQNKTKYDKNDDPMKSGYSIDNINRIVCLNCNKSYKYKSGFYRHRKKCVENNKLYKNANAIEPGQELATLDDKTSILLMNAIMKATETNSKLCERIVALENTVASSNRIVTNNNITNNINKQEFNINLFLNQECKNAMNLKDFLRNIQLNIDDLNYTASNGYIKGITNIFMKNLEEMALNERPIHSVQDDTNHQFYIKDENKWECDNKDAKIEQTIDTLTKRQINKIKDWETQHPNWENTDAGIEEYTKIIQIIMGGGSDHDRDNNKKLIKKELVDKIKLNTLSMIPYS